MTTFPTTVARQLTRGAFAALLALGYSAAHAQAVPKPAPAEKPLPQNVAYYLDGKRVTSEALRATEPSSIQSIDVVKDATAKRSLGLGQDASDGVVLVTTKANANSPAVEAFNKRFPKQPGTPEQSAAVAAAQAYLAQHYPAAKVEAVFPVKDKTDRYNATFTNQGQRLYLLFDGQGHPVEN